MFLASSSYSYPLLGAFWTILMIAAYTGGRCGELLNLRWQDIDLTARRSPSPGRQL